MFNRVVFEGTRTDANQPVSGYRKMTVGWQV